MEEQSNSDHLSSSLTDLMTSLMVIFILLLLVFISHTANKDAANTDVLLKRLQKDLEPQGFTKDSIKEDPKDMNGILIVVPNDLMGFDKQSSQLQTTGENYLRTHIPPMAKVLCSIGFLPNVESVVVEGHTDRLPWRNKSPEESENSNLKLSQDRLMAVVEAALSDLKDRKSE